MAAPKGKSKTDLSTDAKSNFGSKGWLMVVFVGVMLYLQNGTSSDGPNIVIPYMAEVHGWERRHHQRPNQHCGDVFVWYILR